MDTTLRPALRERRLDRGWTQERLGREAGITRQSYAAIEAGRSVPSTEVALRLARALGATVEELFPLPDESPLPLRARDPGLPHPVPFGQGGSRVRLARVSGRLTAFPLLPGGIHAEVPADGVTVDPGEGGELGPGEVLVEPLPGPRADGRPPPDLVVAGCDPAFGLVAEHLRRREGVEVLWLPAGSRAALEALARGVVHVAGVHLQDPGSGAYNEPWIRRLVPFPVARIGFAEWEQALLAALGNPLGLGSVGDLVRPRLRLVNREPGSGSRALLERCLREAGVPPEGVAGFGETAARGHAEVAAAISAGTADAGVAIRAVAGALGLHAIPLTREPYELVVPEALMDARPVEALVRALRTPTLRRQVEAMGGYDAAPMGRVA
jgi:putative molybdopterin biosynthesis protein